MPKTTTKKASAARLSNKPIPMRLDEESRLLVRRAAMMSGVTVSQFMRQHVLEAARRTVEAQQVIRLSLEAAENFAAALSGPATPNERLTELFRRHRGIPPRKAGEGS
ncbi:DUF1778 domain-containing protein [Calidithermus chliarophilus]|uniref:type II toxin-antitoxin system TacA family antitoxin n=1 Tax=Calidithermus chliarophilus TaxID=52023 RepID=UPI0009FC9ACB|nr:DUF1778 domain-containing protein [Calidithermus chliarophilus]